MKKATITEVKNGLSAYIDRVKAGESILITDRGVPVAVIEPAAGRLDISHQLSRLERDGIVRRRRGRRRSTCWPCRRSGCVNPSTPSRH